MGRRLKAVDVYRVANLTRNQFRGLLAELSYKFEAEAASQPRVARTYSPHDFLVILIACELDTTVGLKRSTIAALLPAIAYEISGPRPVARAPKLVLTMNPPTARYVDSEANLEQGVILSLAEIFARADSHMQQAGCGLLSSQVPLNFGPALVGQTADTEANSPHQDRRARR
ncbi:hypothetical protein F8A86_11565 [Betaproteobacteria bacterium SCN1]|jgi:hypothetical protein|nr:hypothetical protein F8A86_11565 [Betaproteobacteria bacterium SCN1]